MHEVSLVISLLVTLHYYVTYVRHAYLYQIQCPMVNVLSFMIINESMSTARAL